MSKMILDTYGSKIKASVSDNHKLGNLILYITKFMDKNHEVIFDQGPTKKLLFSTQDQKAILDFVDVTSEEVSKVLKTVESIKAGWQLLNDPYIIISCYVIRELTIQKKIRERDLVLMYLAMKVYSGLFNKYFPYSVNPQIMLYTLNDLSDKFKYKSLKNNYNVFKDVVVQSHGLYENILIKGDDEMLNTYFSQIYGRLNKIMRNIGNLYYKNRDSKNYLNSVKSYDDESGELLDYENSSALLLSLAESASSYFVSNTTNMEIARQVATRNNIPSGTVYQTLISLKKSESAESILNLTNLMVSVIYDADPALLGKIRTKEFILTAIKQLSVSNSNNKNLIDLKNKLDYILNEYCSKYASTQRAATKMSYRNAIYSYFVFILVLSNKR